MRLLPALRRIAAGAAIGALLGAVAAQAAQPATAASNDNSAVTVSGRGEFKDMRFTVSQTAHLTSQAVTVSWTGGTGTSFAGTQFNTDFVQIMQCWGADDHTVASNPGPSRTQCQYGASPSTDRTSWPGNGYDDTRSVTYSASPSNYGQDNRYGAGGAFGQGEVPFKSVDGTVITSGTQNNKLYNHNTTNEVDFARTSSDGTGSEFFEVQTAYEAPHLGCGASTAASRACWLVIVPQGHLDLDGNPYADQTQVNAGSPVSSTNWANRVAVKLNFNKVGSSCALGSDERTTLGSELVADAMTSWQAAMCSTGTVYGFTQLDEPDARDRLATSGAKTGLAYTTRPVTAATDVTYSPAALSGTVIGVNIERRAKSTASDAVKKLTGTRVGSIDLNARLVAKLLTESYRNSVYGSISTKYVDGTATLKAAKNYGWAKTNPTGLATDPEFLKYNPQFADLSVSETPATDTDLITSLGRSDSARSVWKWIESDKAARRFLAGIPDEWGMIVNPYYSTNADQNRSGGAFDLDRDDYPKSDPWCTILSGSGATYKQCMTDFHPYVEDMHSGALHTRRADVLWKSTWDALSTPPAYKSNGPQTVGSRFVITITDAASAARYGLQTARLRNAKGTFVAPTSASLLAAAKSASGDGVAEIDPATVTASKAYPLAQLVYAAVRPSVLTAAARKDYAALLTYAGGSGQTSGTGPGELPPGYAPLSSSLRAEARTAAAAVASWKSPSDSADPAETTGSDTGDGSDGGLGTGTTATESSSAASPAVSSSPSFDGGTAVQVTANGTTPADPASSLRYAVPVGAALGAAAALGAPFAGGAKPRVPLPLRIPLPGGRSLTVLPRVTLPSRLRRSG
ncbi:hypothetical protein [Streptomyces sp. NBC_01262]|uniref:hypothetical protein n=1 Tax=Streptomyces sp. NBC_01262 TaxID=2903803 RepID=UPI002E35A9DF|nr:hypothetical protein [Streptomyces sp. NBC_01262]